MSGRSIKRLKRLVHLNNLMFERQARAIEVARTEKHEAARDVEDIQTLLGGEGIVSASFSDVALQRAARSKQRQLQIEEELTRLLGVAVETRAAGAAFKNRLEATIQQQGKAISDLALQDVADRVSRKRKSSL